MAAPSYVGYQRRDTSAYPDWGAIGGTISDVFTNEATRRQEEKDKLERQTREALQTIKDAPTGEFKPGNEFVLGYAGDAQQMLMELNKQLKAGLIKPRDYTILRQNALDNTNRMFSIMKGYQEEYANKMDRFQKDESAGREPWEMEQIEGLANLKNTRAYIDPTTFDVSIAKVDDKGNIIKESIVGMKQLENRIKTKYDKYKYDDALNKEKSALGTFVRAAKAPGKITTITDIKDNPEWGEYVNGVVEKIKANPFNAESILVDQMGYEYTRDPKEAAANPEMILMEQAPDGTFQAKITPDQEKAIAERIKGDLEIRLEDEVKIQAVTEPRETDYQWRYAAGQQAAQETNLINNLHKIFTGSPEEVDDALLFFQGVNPDIQKMTRTGDRLTLVDRSGERTIPLVKEDGTPITLSQFIERAATSLTDIKDIKKAIDQAGVNLNTPFNPSGLGSFEVKEELPSGIADVFYLGDDGKSTISLPQEIEAAGSNEEKIGKALSRAFESNPRLGARIKKSDDGNTWWNPLTWGASPYILIETPYGEERITISDNPNENMIAVDDLIKKISGNQSSSTVKNDPLGLGI